MRSGSGSAKAVEYWNIFEASCGILQVKDSRIKKLEAALSQENFDDVGSGGCELEAGLFQENSDDVGSGECETLRAKDVAFRAGTAGWRKPNSSKSKRLKEK